MNLLEMMPKKGASKPSSTFGIWDTVVSVFQKTRYEGCHRMQLQKSESINSFSLSHSKVFLLDFDAQKAAKPFGIYILAEFVL